VHALLLCLLYKQTAVAHISHLQLSRAFNRWREAAQQLRQLRAKAQLVLARTLERQLRTAYSCWRAYVAYRSWKYGQVALAVAHWHGASCRRATSAWKASIQVSLRCCLSFSSASFVVTAAAI
jgi:hypothetical protein